LKAFSQLRIVEIAGSSAGGYAGKLFSDYGARVVRIEPPGEASDALASHHQAEAQRAFLDTGKTRVGLALGTKEGKRSLDRLLASADVVIESSAPEPLRPVTAASNLPLLIKTYISPLGLDGPYASFRSNELTDEALGGHLYLNGEADREPICRPGRQTLHQAGAHGFIGTLAALLSRARSGRGQTVETSHLEGLASLHQYTTVMWRQAGHILQRVGNGQGGPWHPVGNFQCRDGYVALAMPVTVMLQPFLEAAGLGHLMEDPRFAEDFDRGRHRHEFNEALRPWLMEHDAAEIIELGQSVAAPIGPVKTLLEILEDPHLEARGFWTPAAADGELLLPRGPFLIDGRAPLPQPASTKQAAFDELAAAWGTPDTRREAAETAETKPTAPLEGIRILDLTRVWAGPLATRILGDLGADVIRIESPWARGPAEVPADAGIKSHLFPEDEPADEPFNREVSFNKLNRSKRGLTLDLSTADGKALFEALVPQADVVIENFSPRVMAKLGLGWDRLRELNPSIVYVAMPGFGSSGPYRDWLAFGPLVEAASGLTAGLGYPGSGPYRSGLAWPDPVSALHAASATLLALYQRQSDPLRRGRTVEVPMLEALLAFNGDQILEAQLRGQSPPRQANRHPYHAPQGCYRCAGEDEWIAISVTTDGEWSSLCGEASLPEQFASMSLEDRRSAHDEIDTALGAWTIGEDATETMHRLQGAGIIAAAVADGRDLVENPQLEARDFWVELDHRSVGRRSYPGLPIHFSETPARATRGAPCLGEHNREILADLVGLGSDEIDALFASGIIADRPPEGATFRGVPKNEEEEAT